MSATPRTDALSKQCGSFEQFISEFENLETELAQAKAQANLDIVEIRRQNQQEWNEHKACGDLVAELVHERHRVDRLQAELSESRAKAFEAAARIALEYPETVAPRRGIGNELQAKADRIRKGLE